MTIEVMRFLVRLYFFDSMKYGISVSANAGINSKRSHG